MNWGQICLSNVRSSWICPPSLQVWCPHAANGQRPRAAPVRAIGVAAPRALEAGGVPVSPPADASLPSGNGLASPVRSNGTDQPTRPGETLGCSAGPAGHPPRAKRKRRRKALPCTLAATQSDSVHHVLTPHAIGSKPSGASAPSLTASEVGSPLGFLAPAAGPGDIQCTQGPRSGDAGVGHASDSCRSSSSSINGASAEDEDHDRQSSHARASSSNSSTSSNMLAIVGGRSRRGHRRGRSNKEPHSGGGGGGYAGTSALHATPSGVGSRASSGLPCDPVGSHATAANSTGGSGDRKAAQRGARSSAAGGPESSAPLSGRRPKAGRQPVASGSPPRAAGRVSGAAVAAAAAAGAVAAAAGAARVVATTDAAKAATPKPPGPSEPGGPPATPRSPPAELEGLEAPSGGSLGLQPGLEAPLADHAARSQPGSDPPKWADDLGRSVAHLLRLPQDNTSARQPLSAASRGADAPGRTGRAGGAREGDPGPGSASSPGQQGSGRSSRRRVAHNLSELVLCCPALADIPAGVLAGRLDALADLLGLPDGRAALRLAQAVPNLLLRERRELEGNLAALEELVAAGSGAGSQAARQMCAKEPLLLVMPPARLLGALRMYRDMLLLSGVGVRALVARFPKLLVYKPETMRERIVTLRRLLCPGYSLRYRALLAGEGDARGDAAAAAGADIGGSNSSSVDEADVGRFGARQKEPAAGGSGVAGAGAGSSGSSSGGGGGGSGQPRTAAALWRCIRRHRPLRILMHHAVQAGARGMLWRPGEDGEDTTAADSTALHSQRGAAAAAAVTVVAAPPQTAITTYATGAVAATTALPHPAQPVISIPSTPTPKATPRPGRRGAPRAACDLPACYQWACSKYVGQVVHGHPIMLTFSSRTLVSHFDKVAASLGPARLRRMLSRQPLLLLYNPHRLRYRMACLRTRLDCKRHPQAIEALVTRAPHVLKRSRSAILTCIRSLDVWKIPARAKVRMLFSRPRLLTLSPGEVFGRCRWLRAFMLSNAYYHAALRRVPPSVMGVLVATLFRGWARLQYLAETEQEGEMALLEAVECPQAEFERRFPAFAGWRRWKVQQMGRECPWREPGSGQVRMPIGLPRKGKAASPKQDGKPRRQASLNDLLRRRQELQRQHQASQGQAPQQATVPVVVADEEHVVSGRSTVLRPRRILNMPVAQEAATTSTAAAAPSPGGPPEAEEMDPALPPPPAANAAAVAMMPGSATGAEVFSSGLDDGAAGGMPGASVPGLGLGLGPSPRGGGPLGTGWTGPHPHAGAGLQPGAPLSAGAHNGAGLQADAGGGWTVQSRVQQLGPRALAAAAEPGDG